MSLKITQLSEGEICSFQLSGEVNEDKNLLDSLKTSSTQKLQLHCKGIRRINSVGVKTWIQFFSALRAEKVQLCFLECSPCLIQQANLFPKFLMKEEVKSLYAPFICEGCGKESNHLFQVEEIKRENFGKLLKAACQHCGTQASFDDDPEEYFQFLLEK